MQSWHHLPAGAAVIVSDVILKLSCAVTSLQQSVLAGRETTKAQGVATYQQGQVQE